MATTSLWRIKGRLNRVIEYIENPEKTFDGPSDPGGEKASIENVVGYVTRDSATDHAQLVSAINCTVASAIEEMQRTKQTFGKTGGTIAYHGYQSFKEGEVTPEQAHMIGCRLAEELWGDRYEVLIATHIDKETHIHNHFIINTVSFVDGIKFHRTKEDYRRMQEVSDRLCRENGLSVVRHPEDGKGKNHGEWLAEKNGRPTWRSMIRKDIDRAVNASLTEREFFRHLEEMGYEFKLYTSRGEELLRPSLKPKDSARYFRFDRLGPEYDLEEIRSRILENIRREPVIPEEEKRQASRYRREHPPRMKHKGLAALYYYYCYELHIIVKYPASAKRVSSYMRADLLKLDRLDEQTRLLGENEIETLEDLDRFRKQTKEMITELSVIRDQKRAELKRAAASGQEEEAVKLRISIAGIKSDLTKFRKELKLCDRIEERADRMERELEQWTEQQKTTENKATERKEERKDELFRRSGGTGREDVVKRH